MVPTSLPSQEHRLDFEIGQFVHQDHGSLEVGAVKVPLGSGKRETIGDVFRRVVFRALDLDVADFSFHHKNLDGVAIEGLSGNHGASQEEAFELVFGGQVWASCFIWASVSSRPS